MSNLPTKQDLLDKATKCMIVNKVVAKTIECKTMTRRVCKIQPRADACDELYADEYNHNNQNWAYWCRDGRLHEYLEKPQYKAGDIAWLREPARIDRYNEVDLEMEFTYISDNNSDFKIGIDEKYVNIDYKENREPFINAKWIRECKGVPNGCLKTMARYFFEITAVRVERLQDITLKDILKEGCPIRNSQMYQDDIREWFIKLWNSTAKKGINDWDSNPYVFVYEFKLLKYKG